MLSIVLVRSFIEPDLIIWQQYTVWQYHSD